MVTQMLDLADKDVKAIVTMLKDVKENMLLMNEKTVYVKETGNYKKKKKNQMEILAEKYNIQNKIKKLLLGELNISIEMT